MNYNPFSLEGKTVMVTGASSGIGRVVAIECSKIGALLIITGRNEDRLKNTIEQMEGIGHKYIVADIRVKEQLELLTNSISKIQGLVHCAGIIKYLPFDFISIDVLNSIIETNFYGPLFLTQNLIKNKRIENGCSIVFISSISGITCAAVGNGMYSASKGAITSMAKIMALEFVRKKIRVNCIMPGMVQTEMTNNLTFSEEEIKEDMKKYPLGYGVPRDVALGVVYLLSDASKWITGTDLKMDGGYTLH